MKRTIYAVNCGFKIEPKTVNGYIETIETSDGFISIGYDFRRDLQRWVATDIKTGLAVSPSHKMKKEAVIDFVHRNSDFIYNLVEKAFKKNSYNIGNFREWVNARNLNQTDYNEI